MSSDRGEVDDVHSEGHIDGDGRVVGRHVENGRTTWQDVDQLSAVSMLMKLMVVMLMVINHVGVGVLPIWKRRRCYSGF